jgi:hypothetical protein
MPLSFCLGFFNPAFEQHKGYKFLGKFFESVTALVFGLAGLRSFDKYVETKNGKKALMINKLLFLSLLVAGRLAADTYVAQTATGNGSGNDAKIARRSVKDVGPGTVNHLVGTVTSS